MDEYLKVARENDLIIKYVLETHRQEDFVIGSKAIAERTDAKIVSLDHELFGHSDIRLKDGEKLTGIGALSWLAFLTAKKPIGITGAFESTSAGLGQKLAPHASGVNAYLAESEVVPGLLMAA